jgi:hypothetical protein
VQHNGSGADSAAPDHEDRRRFQRLAIKHNVRYKLSDGNRTYTGAGNTLNISSNGLLFATKRAFVPAPGSNVDVEILVPAGVDDTAALVLVVRGRVVRTEGRKIAIESRAYEIHGASMPRQR